VVNGEFYGYQAIREKLRAKGYRFKTESDSEIALHLYDEYGLDFVDQLRGEFALVLSDRRSGVLIGVRDRFGINPLFYAEVNGEVFFASEIKALLALGIPAKWDPAGVMGEFATVQGHATMFQNIRQVPPGCMLIAKDGKTEIKQYWDNIYPTEDVLAKDTRSNDEVISGFRKQFLVWHRQNWIDPFALLRSPLKVSLTSHRLRNERRISQVLITSPYLSRRKIWVMH